MDHHILRPIVRTHEFEHMFVCDMLNLLIPYEYLDCYFQMPLTLKSNISALTSIRSLSKSQKMIRLSIQRLSSGVQYEHDDPMASSANYLRNKKEKLTPIMDNTNLSMSLVQSGEAGLNSIHGILTKMRSIAVDANTSTSSFEEKSIQFNTFNELRNTISFVSNNLTFNGISILGMSNSSTNSILAINVGVDNIASQKISIHIARDFGVSLGSLGITDGSLNLTASGAQKLLNAETAILKIDSALSTINQQRSKIGVAQQKLENVLSTVQTKSLAYDQLISAVIDVDYAEETVNLTRYQIMQQATIAVLGQTKSVPQSILTLLS